jgi:hypothetical protein
MMIIFIIQAFDDSSSYFNFSFTFSLKPLKDRAKADPVHIFFSLATWPGDSVIKLFLLKL